MTELTDVEAIQALDSTPLGRAEQGTIFATRTIIHPVKQELKPGNEEVVFRPYVIMGVYYPERKWLKALDVEKRYSGLNKRYRENLKSKGLPMDRKAPANPLNVEEVEIG